MYSHHSPIFFHFFFILFYSDLLCVLKYDVYGAPSLIELRKFSVWKEMKRYTHRPAREKKLAEKWKGENGFCGAGTVFILFVRCLMIVLGRTRWFWLDHTLTHTQTYVPLTSLVYVVCFFLFIYGFM